MEMLILFVNAQRKTEQGRLRFQNFYKHIRTAMHSTVFFGNEVVETVRPYDQLSDYIYDEITFRTDERVRRRFQSLQYIIIDGSCGFAPWSENMADLLLLIRAAIEGGKKILCHGFGHFAASYCLATGFNKHYVIAGRKNPGKAAELEWEEGTGELRQKGVRVGSSGVRVVEGSRPFADKSSQAVARGLTLGSKFEYVVFDAKSGSRLVRGVDSPFSFYWKSKLFCVSRTVSQSKMEVLFQTENGAPLAFSYKNLLSVQGLCQQFIKLVTNWFLEHTHREVVAERMAPSKSYQTIAFENKLQFRKTLTSSASQLRFGKSQERRPQSSKFSTLEFEKPAVRCSGKYETLDERYTREEMQKKSLNVGRSRLVFQGKMEKYQIGNYVQREPSRPPSSHKFREVHREKWLGGRDFFNC